MHFRRRSADVRNLEGLLAHTHRYGETLTFLGYESFLHNLAVQLVGFVPTEFGVLLSGIHCDYFQRNGVRHGVSGLDEARHRIGVVLQLDVGHIAGLGVGAESEVLVLLGHVVDAIVTSVVHYVGVEVNYGHHVVGGVELVLHLFHLLRNGHSVLIGRLNGERNISNRAVRLLLVLVLVLLIESLDVGVAYLDERVSHSKIGLVDELDVARGLAAIEGELGIQLVGGDAVREEAHVFLLQIGDANGFLPVVPVGLGLLQVGLVFRILGFLLEAVKELHQVAAVELAGLVVESAARRDNLVDVVTDADLRELVRSNGHTDFLGLCLHGVVRDEHLPNAVVHVGHHVFVEVVAAGLDFVHLIELFFGGFIFGVVDFLTFYNPHVLAVAREIGVGTGQEIPDDERQHGETHYNQQEYAMITDFS